jgi:CHAD domain-containing protein
MVARDVAGEPHVSFGVRISTVRNGDRKDASIEQLMAHKVKVLARAHAGEKDAADRSVKTVHQLRVATRRLKAALDLAEPYLPDKPRRKFSRSLRRLRRALGPLRDTDVMLQHLEEVGEDERFEGAVVWFTRRLRQERGELADTVRDEVAAGKELPAVRAWDAIRRDVRRAEGDIRRRAGGAIRDQLAAVCDYSTLLARCRSAAPHTAGPDVHALRICGKRLRYTLELAEPVDPEAAGEVLALFKQLQDALGLWHDYVVLGENLLDAARRDELPLHRGLLYGSVLALAQRSWQRSEAELDNFCRLWSQRRERLSRLIAVAFGIEVTAQEPARIGGRS